MKKIALYILCGVMALFTSCDPSLLDLQNENTLSTGIYWKTESDIEAGVIAVYGMFYRQGTWTRNIYTQMIGMADEGVSYAGWTEMNTPNSSLPIITSQKSTPRYGGNTILPFFVPIKC